MSIPRYRGGESLLQVFGRAEISGRIQSAYNHTEQGHVHRHGEEGKWEKKNQMQHL